MLVSVIKLENIKKIGKSILIFIGFYYSYLLQYIPVILFSIDTKKISGSMKLIVELSCFSEVCCFLLLLLLYKKDLIEEWKKLKDQTLKKLDTGLACWALGLMIMAVSNFILAMVFHSTNSNNEETVQSLLKTAPLLMGIDICIIAPFVEEMVFRKTAKDIFKNKYLFVLTSGLIFGLAHVIGQSSTLADWLYLIPYGAMGASFAISYSKTDTIYTPMIFHMLHNSLIFIISVLI